MDEFSTRVIEKIGYYVYLLIDPSDNGVFYVGKGTGNRCFSHLAEAQVAHDDSAKDYPKLDLIRSIECSGHHVQIVILRHGLTEPEALIVEATIIDLLSNAVTRDLTNRVSGHDTAARGWMSAADIESIYGAQPVQIHADHKVALIRISRLYATGMSDDDLYEATRKWWKVAKIRRQSESAYAPQWAMAVYGGVVRAVYRIDTWLPSSDEDIDLDDTRRGRWVFQGTRDREMEQRYLHRDVSSYLRASDTSPFSQVPVRYIHCQPEALVIVT